MSVKRYEHPPVVEAIVEFRFPSPLELSGVALAQFSEVLETQMPGLQMGTEPYDAQGVVFARIRFDAPDARSVVILAPQSISVHRLGLYSGWEEFRPLIACALEASRSFGTDPVHVTVRYNNVVDVPAGARLEGWVRFPIFRPESVQSIRQFAVRQVADLADGVVETLDVRIVPGRKPDHVGVYLDLACESPVDPVQDPMQPVDRLRDRERDLFESLIGNDAREAFVLKG